MRSHTKEVVLPFTPEQMFELVSDIKRYPEFVKWITALRVSAPRDEGSVHHCIGEAVVAFKGFTNNFATRVRADRDAKSVAVELERGPFKHLINRWSFAGEGVQGTRIVFYIEYEFSNFILQALANANHDYAVEQIMKTFIDEAKRRYEDAGSANT